MDPDAKEQQLTELKAQALKAYSLKDYAASSDFYAQACELQSSIRGDDDPRNAYLLYLYGRSLFQVALKKSDVLGGAPLPEEGKSAEDHVKPVIEPLKKPEDPVNAAPAAKPGFFSFTGDENWDDSDGEDAGEDEKEGEGEEGGDDDFTLAWEILDFARVLFLKQLAPPAPETKSRTEEPVVSATTANSSTESITSTSKEEASMGSAVATNSLTEEEIKTIKAALADTYDILGEVSLESESFAQAAKDLRSSLDAKLELYPLESTLISEAHFKLSLALEFAAAGEGVSGDDQKKGREDAAVEMEKAIASCKARITKEEAELGVDNGSKGKGKEVTTKSLEEAREMVTELEVRLADLKSPIPRTNLAPGDDVGGLLGQVLGEDQEVARKRIQDAISQANDLTGLIRKKPQASSPAPPTTMVVVPTNGTQSAIPKRKLDDLREDTEQETVEETSKKARVEDGLEPETA